MHPLDQFKAFKRMVDDGMSKEEVADAYRTTPRYISQRLRLARVAPSLLDAYARSEMTLAMLEAFTVNPHHGRQEQVWEAIQRSHNRQTWHIRDLLTETTVPTDDKRALFVGIDTYEQAGGVMLRDLFSDEDEGWLENPELLDRLVSDKLKDIADKVAAEGWKWVAVDTDLPYGHDRGLRVLTGTFLDLTDAERVTREALREEYEQLEAESADYDELPDDLDARLGEIEVALAAFEKRPTIYDEAEIARAGVFISIDRAGELVVARGYVRPEDEAPVDVEDQDNAGDGEPGAETGAVATQAGVQRAVITIGGEPVDAEDDEDDAIKPLPERLVIELTAHRTLALHEALANNPHVAMTALLHRMVMERYHYSAPTGCLEISVRQQRFGVQGADLSDTPSAKAIDERFNAWKADVPSDEGALWDWIAALDDASRMALLAHCVSYGVNALYERPNPHSGSGVSQFGLDRRLSGADRIARATGFDMVADGGWRPTVDNYLGRVTKPRILEAVREGAGERAAQLIGHLMKGDMAKEAERLRRRGRRRRSPGAAGLPRRRRGRRRWRRRYRHGRSRRRTASRRGRMTAGEFAPLRTHPPHRPRSSRPGPFSCLETNHVHSRARPHQLQHPAARGRRRQSGPHGVSRCRHPRAALRPLRRRSRSRRLCDDALRPSRRRQSL